MSDFAPLLRTLLARRDLDGEQMAHAIGAIMDADWSQVQAAGFLAALATKGETPAELVGAAEAMRARSLHVEHALPLLADTCGTGGDGARTINVSTAAGFVLAGCGVPVAKHGNRAASSQRGSADVLEAAGVRIDAGPELARLDLEHRMFAFLFAQLYHPAIREVGPTRRELGVRTIFNLLGPIANPARATHQVIGVANPAHLELVGDALLHLGAVAGAVVHASSGIDEVAGDAPTHVYQFSPRGIVRWEIEPADYGIAAPLAAIVGGEPAVNAQALRAILEGERSPRADVVALNAALALVVVERGGDLREGLAAAGASLQSGAALAVFESLRGPTEMQFA